MEITKNINTLIIRKLRFHMKLITIPILFRQSIILMMSCILLNKGNKKIAEMLVEKDDEVIVLKTSHTSGCNQHSTIRVSPTENRNGNNIPFIKLFHAFRQDNSIICSADIPKTFNIEQEFFQGNL